LRPRHAFFASLSPARLLKAKALWVLIFAAVLQMFGAGRAMAADVILETYRIGIDLGNTPGTGCAFSLGGLSPASLPGFELQVTVSVDVGSVPARVASAQVETCSGGVFGAPAALSGFAIELNSGLLGADSVVGAVPRSFLNGAQTVRLAVHSSTADGAQDALYTVDGSPGGAAIFAAVPPALEIPTLSSIGMIVLQLGVMGAAWVAWKRHRSGVLLVLVCVLMVSNSLLVWAAFGSPVATDATNDASLPDSRGEIVAAYVDGQNPNLGLRIDIANIETATGFSLFHSSPGKYVSADLTSGLLTATQDDPLAAFRRFEFVSAGGSGVFALKSVGSGKYVRYTSVDNQVVADAADTSAATKWIVFVTSSCGTSGSQVLFIQQGGADPVNIMTFDAGSGELRVLVNIPLANAISQPGYLFCMQNR
jgi:hypothetical protein